MHLSCYKTQFLADRLSPVSLYLKGRDLFPGSVLFESSDFHVSENSKSIVGFNPLVTLSLEQGVFKHVEGKNELRSEEVQTAEALEVCMEEARLQYASLNLDGPVGFYGFVSYDINRIFQGLQLKKAKRETDFPCLKFQLFEFLVEIDHFTGIGRIFHYSPNGEDKSQSFLNRLLRKPVPNFTFSCAGEEEHNITPSEYLGIVDQGIEHCQQGDVFQVVLSRKFSRPFHGDDFWVYRALRSINPGPYQFYTDFGDLRILGSSPETQISIENGVATVHPIAGTVKRTGDDAEDQKRAEQLMAIPKENEEHNMLVDLARNDLSKHCREVEVCSFKQIQYYSHVIHMVSEVQGKLQEGVSAFKLLLDSFPAGTLSGAPKYKAMELIETYEKDCREIYGGAIGFLGLNNELKMAITIRSLASRNGKMSYQAGAGIVRKSSPQSELEEIDHKVQAIRSAIAMAETYSNQQI